MSTAGLQAAQAGKGRSVNVTLIKDWVGGTCTVCESGEKCSIDQNLSHYNDALVLLYLCSVVVVDLS